jgi:Sec-independent protein secretion pathway component TatC
LIPLFAVGVFLAYTLSQSGMVLHWWRERGRGWALKAALNGIGALATAVTFVIVSYTKFVGGAWIAIILIPVLVWFFLNINTRRKELEPDYSNPDIISI